jgi:CoA:oxalate CoA-transferase
MILNGVRILDLSQIMAGPFGTMLLADLGAEVIKIENPQGGDLSRATLHYTHKGESAYYVSFNRNKKSMTLNLRDEKAREIFYELVKISDVVYDNFRSGTLEKLKIDYESLKKVNPKIISCSVTGFGSNSPYKDRPALDLLIQAMGGVMSFTGEPGRPPVRLGYPMGDRAQYYFLEKVIPEPIGSGHVSAVPIRAFVARDGKYLVIDSAQEKFFQNLCQVLGIERLGKDPRYSTRNARLKNVGPLMKILEDEFMKKDRDEWLRLLIQGDVPAGPVNNLAEALSDPSVLARNMVVSVDHLGEEIKMVGNPIKMSKTKEERFKGAPTLGQHTEKILSQYLGYTTDQIHQLKHLKII